MRFFVLVFVIGLVAASQLTFPTANEVFSGPLPNDLDADHPILSFLRNQAALQEAHPDEDHNAEAFCASQLDGLFDLLWATYLPSTMSRSNHDLFNMGRFLRLVCPSVLFEWRFRRIAILQALYNPDRSWKVIPISLIRSRIVDSTYYALSNPYESFRGDIAPFFSTDSGHIEVVSADSIWSSWFKDFSREAFFEDNYLFESNDGFELRLSSGTSKVMMSRYVVIGKFFGIKVRTYRVRAPFSLPLKYYSRLVGKPLKWDVLSQEDKKASGLAELSHAYKGIPVDHLQLLETALNKLTPLEEEKLEHIRKGLEWVLGPQALELMTPQDLRCRLQDGVHD